MAPSHSGRTGHQGRPYRAVMATRPEKTTKDIPGVIAPPPLIYLGGLGLGFLLEALLPGMPGGSFAGLLGHVVGAACLLRGLGLVSWWASSFRRADTPMPPYE